MKELSRVFALLGIVMITISPVPSWAASAQEIDIRVDDALKRFREEVDGANNFLAGAKGVLVFPRVVKAGIGIGGEYGEGALRMGGATTGYYSTASASVGLQFGAQARTVILVFLASDALEAFRESSGWEVGVDGSVALIKLGEGGSLDSTNAKDPIVGFIFGNKGLMYNLTLEGSKITKLNK